MKPLTIQIKKYRCINKEKIDGEKIMKFIGIEIFKFFKKSLPKMIVGMILVAGVFIWSSYRANMTQLENIENVESVDKQDGADFVVETEPAFFQFIVEYEDGSLFNNPLLIEEYILQEEVLNQASTVTNTNLNLVKVIENTENNVLVDINDFGDSKVIGVYRDDATYINEFYVNVGNERENIRIANFFYDYISEGQIPFIADKDIYFFEDPKILSVEDETEATLETESQQINFSLIKNLIIGSILGALLSLAALLGLTFLSKKLKYSFSYTIQEDDYYFLVDSKLDYEEELKKLLYTPQSANRVVVKEDNSADTDYFGKLLSDISSNEPILQVNNFLTIENPSQIDRLIYIIEEDVTSRKWYNNQRKLDRAYEIPTVVIQVNKNY